MSNNYDGPVLLDDITSYFGFGRAAGGAVSTGPRVLVVNSNPSGVLIAPRGSMALRYDDGNVAIYQNTDGNDDWTQITSGGGTPAPTGSGISVIRQRVTLAELNVANTSTFAAWGTSLPAHSLAIGAMLYVTTPPAGPGLGSLTVTNFMFFGSAFNTIEIQQLFGASAGYQRINNNPNAWNAQNQILIDDTARTHTWSVSADVNLDTLTDCDFTIYTAYFATPQGGALP